MDEEQLREWEALPKSSSCRLVDFDQAQIMTLRSFPPQYVLHVSGTKPYLNMQVDLVPLVYIQQPEYWGIEVVGCLPGGIGHGSVHRLDQSKRYYGNRRHRGNWGDAL